MSAQPKKEPSALATLPPVTAAAMTVAFSMYPVDIVRALVMSQASGQRAGISELVGNFYKAHGAMGFVKQGLGAEMARATVSRVIKFWLQPVTHKLLYGKKQSEGTSISKGMAGAAATIPEVLAISPFENVKLAQQLDKEKRFKGTADVFSHLYKTRGLPGLYMGYFGMQIRQMLWTGGYFYSLEVFKKPCEKTFGKGTVAADTMAGFGAGVFGTILNCWTDVVRTGIQKQAVAETFNPAIARPVFGPAYMISGVTSVMGTAATIYANRGIPGLYAGFMVKSVYLGGSGALLAILMPRFKSWWGVGSD
jgi:solute carrier family 25 (mitochondrial 2-oxodicarboxylate transporter), member 21